jgi:hypothetical protein
MTLTLQAQAQQTITDSVLKNTHLLIEALKTTIDSILFVDINVQLKEMKV